MYVSNNAKKQQIIVGNQTETNKMCTTSDRDHCAPRTSKKQQEQN